MTSLRPALTQLRGRWQTSAPQWQQLQHRLQCLHISPTARHTRLLSTHHSDSEEPIIADDVNTKHEAVRNAMLGQLIADMGPDAPAQKPGHLGGHIQPVAVQRDLMAHGAQDSIDSRDQPVLNARLERGFGETGEGDARHQSRSVQHRLGGQQFGDRAPGGEQGGQGRNGALDVQGPNQRKDDEGGTHPMVAAIEKPTIYARPMPASPSYFSRQAGFNDSYLQLQKLMRKYSHLPTAPSDQIKRVALRSIKDYRLTVGENIKAAPFARCMTIVKRLYKIHPDVKPPQVHDALAPFLRDINPHNMKLKDIPIDKFGRTLGVGKRKTSVARAWVVEGVGEVLVNGKSLADAFGRIHDRESAVWALKATARTDKYNVWALVEGGGTTGQAEALAMAVGKALMAHEPALKPALRRAGVVTRDPRGVERKKPGHLKARKKPAWVKR